PSGLAQTDTPHATRSSALPVRRAVARSSPGAAGRGAAERARAAPPFRLQSNAVAPSVRPLQQAVIAGRLPGAGPRRARVDPGDRDHPCRGAQAPPWDATALPQTVTRRPSRSPSHSRTVQARRSRFFQSCAWANVSSSALKRVKTDRDATRIILRSARLKATVRRRGSSRNALDASTYCGSLSV